MLGSGVGGAVDLGTNSAVDLGASSADRNQTSDLDDVPAGPARHPSQMYATDEHGSYINAYAAQRTDQEYGAGNNQQYPDNNQQYRDATTPGHANTSQFDVDGALAELARGGKIRETNMASLRGESAGQARVAFDPAASVLGEEHREKLGREGGAKPSAAHKNKNQIGSLLYEAKQAEMKILDGRLAGTSHKAMAKQKYGW